MALEKLAPVALVFTGGVLFARRQLIDPAHSKVFADFAFLLAVPCYLFENIATSDLGTLFTWKAILGYGLTTAGCMAAVGAVTWVTTSRQPRQIALRTMASSHVNTAYFAVPVFVMLFGSAAPVFPILLLQVCVLALVVIFVMELDTAQQLSGPEHPGRRARTVAVRTGRAVWASLNTPVVLACNTGLVINLLSVPFPAPLAHAFAFVGDAASPVALFALGLHLGGTGLRIRDTSREEIWLVTVKCLAFPLIMWLTCGYLFGVRGQWLTYLVMIAAMPTPQNLFVYAQRYGVGVDLAASLVVKTSAASLLLLPLWISAV